MDSIPHKRCTKCGVDKPLAEFHRSTHHTGGYKPRCKECRRNEVKATDETRLTPDTLKVCRKCKELKPAREFDANIRVSSGYYSTCRACRRATARAWKFRNKDRIRAYEEENREHLSALRYDWQKRNRDRYLAARRKRDKTPKARMYALLKVHQRRVAKNGSVTPDQVQELKQRQKKCYYCGKPFTRNRPSTLDHVIPLAKGGAHDISNIVLACRSCNCSKHDRLLRLL